MSTEAPTPRRVEYVGPEGWTIWADEDGTHLSAPSRGSLEQPDVLRLIALYEAVRGQVAADRIPAPKPPTKEQIQAMYSLDQRAYLARRAAEAVSEVISPSAPF